MKKPFEPNPQNGRLACILLDPLSYVHPRRLQLPNSFATPRHRAVINQLLLDSLREDVSQAWAMERYPQQHRLLRYWSNWPQVSTLIGAQLLKSDLAWRGRLLSLSTSVRSFMAMPYQPTMQGVTAQSEYVNRHAEIGPGAWSDGDEPTRHIQGIGLSCLLDWQRAAPAPLLGRLRLMFAPELDRHFDIPRRQAHRDELFLISQALHYAKNHPNHA